jgi:thioredoxin 1
MKGAGDEQMKQGWLMLTAVAGLGLLSACAKQDVGAGTEAVAPAGEKHELIITSEAQFAEKVEGSQGVVLVDFWATWCPPCKIMNPILAGLAASHAGRMTVAKVDVDDNRELAERFKIQSIPTLILFKDGKPVDMKIGALPKAELVQWVDAQLGG